jgi:hypothetical protein
METLTHYLLTDAEREALEVLGTLDYRYTDDLADTDPSASERVVKLFRKVKTQGAYLTSDEVLLLTLSLHELEQCLLTDAETAPNTKTGQMVRQGREADARQVRRTLETVVAGWQSPTLVSSFTPQVFAGVV